MRSKTLAVKVISSILVCILLLSGFSMPAERATAQDDGPQTLSRDLEVVNPYYTIEHLVLEDGSAIDRNIINGPSKPPVGVDQGESAELDGNAIALLDFPSFGWMYGCSAVSAGMIAAYYDNTGFSSMYTGPTNGGVYPITDSSLGSWTDGYDVYHNNPLVASRNGVDGRTTRGSIEDYWVVVGSGANDPYITNGWVQHQWGDAVGDYMKTSRSIYGNVDGATSFYTWTTLPDQLTCDQMVANGIQDDGSVGIRDFYITRGYQIGHCYNQKTDNNAGGFNLAMFQSYIDLGYPILINLAGHSVVGYAYSGSTIYIRDTWSSDPSFRPTMTWGGSYEGMQMQSVSVVLPIQNQVTTHKSYLPMITKPPVLINGDFEMGPAAWNQFSSHGWDVIWNDPTRARQGDWFAWLGGDYDEFSAVSQVVKLPQGANALEFYYLIASDELDCAYDYYRVEVGGNVVLSDWLCADHNTGGYVYKGIDLSAYSGTTQEIMFSVWTDFSVNSNFYLDYVTITRYAKTLLETTNTEPLDPIFFQTK